MRAWLTSLVLLSAPAPVLALQCRPHPELDLTLVWQRRCISWEINGASALLTSNRAAVSGALAAWSNAPCSDLRLDLVDDTTEGVAFHADAPGDVHNVLITTASDPALASQVDSSLVALSFVHFLRATGEIVDVDVAVNDAVHDFGDVSDAASCTERYDLQSVLASELGRALGFADSPEVGSTLSLFVEPCTTERRDLTARDVADLCAVYPRGGLTATCKPAADYDQVIGDLDPRSFRSQRCAGDLALVEEAGCGCSGVGAGSAASSAALVLVVALVRRRRR